MSSWFISLAKNDLFTSAVWKASNDIGYSSYLSFLTQGGGGKPFSLSAASIPQKAARVSTSLSSNVTKPDMVKGGTVNKTQKVPLPMVRRFMF